MHGPVGRPQGEAATVMKQKLQNFRRNPLVPISSVSPFVTCLMACFIPQGASEAPSQKPLSRSGDDDLRDWTQAGHGGARLSPRASRPGGGCGSTRPRRLCHLPLDEFRCAQGGAALCPGGATGRARAPAPRSPAPRDRRPGPASPPSGGPRPVTPWLDPCSLALSRPGPGVGPPPRGPARPRAGPLGLKNHALRSGRPPGRLAPPPADLASGAVARAALEERARQGERLRLAAEATLLWRFALPRAGWWRRAPRGRRPPRPRRQRPSNRAEARTRQAWGPDRTWSRSTRGVWLSVLGAVP
jgi:hypothetical protein